MHAPTNTSAGELFIIDNSDELWKGLKYLSQAGPGPRWREADAQVLDGT
jgi:hypothetical protein